MKKEREIELKYLLEGLKESISRLEKNPVDVVSDETIMKMLNESINNEVQSHLIKVLGKDIQILLRNKLKKNKENFLERLVEQVLASPDFKHRVSKLIIHKLKIKNHE